MPDFVHLHVHSNYSLCRGANSIDQICIAARERGFTHLALTDTNGFYGLVWFIQTAAEHGLTPIVGVHLQNSKHQAVALAKNLEGYRTLCRLISRLQGEDDSDLIEVLLRDHREIVLLSSDLPLLQVLVQHQAIQDLYVELVPHANREETLRFARQNGLPPVASNAAYFIGPDDWTVHRLLRAIDLNTTLTRVPAGELVDPRSWLVTTQEMVDQFPDCPEALSNTLAIAQACTFELDFKGHIFPSFKGPDGEDAQSYLRSEVERGILWRYGGINEAIEKRLDHEMALISAKGFAPYFLVVADAVRQAPRTCGRGSAASSLVSYALGITHVDPIRYDLFFDRFLNPGRKDPPDIDVDFPWDERDDILDYFFKTYGRKCVAMIANHNCFKARSALREIAKVYGLPEGEINTVTKKVAGYWQPADLAQMIETHPAFAGYELRPPWPEIIKLAEKIRGFPRHLSVHCGGVVIAPDGLDRYVPIQPAKKMLRLSGVLQSQSEPAMEAGRSSGNDDEPAGSEGLPHDLSQVQVVQWEKDQAEDMGLVKIDILGNRSLAVIRDAIRAVKAHYGIEIDFNRLNPLQDEATQALLARGDTIGVFYVESPAMRQLQRKTGKGDFEHLVIHSSIIRPAANVFINEYIRRLRGSRWQPLHPRLESLLQETYGIMVYQEDVSKVAMALAGFDSSSADELRKVIGKKHRQKQLALFRDRFFSGAAANGVTTADCEKIWAMILSFSEYSFCKPHSASFALVSFQSAYLRIHFPAEFIAAVIGNMGGYYSAFAYISEARRMGLTILPPDINESGYSYQGRDRSVRVGLMQVKGLTREASRRIQDEREQYGAFMDFNDFLQRVKVDPSDAALLIKSGCFDRLETERSRPQLLWQLHQWRSQRQHIRGEEGKTLNLFQDAADVGALPKPAQYNDQELLQMETDVLGFLLSRHPLTLYQRQIMQTTHVDAADFHLHVGERINAIGWLITWKLISTRKEQLMEFLSFEDTTAIYETVFFPAVYARFAHMMTQSRPYVLTGRVDEQYGAIVLNVENVKFL